MTRERTSENLILYVSEKNSGVLVALNRNTMMRSPIRIEASFRIHISRGMNIRTLPGEGATSGEMSKLETR